MLKNMNFFLPLLQTEEPVCYTSVLYWFTSECTRHSPEFDNWTFKGELWYCSFPHRFSRLKTSWHVAVENHWVHKENKCFSMFPSELEFWCCACGSLSTCHEILGCLNRLLLLLMLLLRALFLFSPMESQKVCCWTSIFHFVHTFFFSSFWSHAANWGECDLILF